MELLDRITIEPGKCGGRPCIRGQRIRVSDVLELVAAEVSLDEMKEEYALEPDDIKAALLYAAKQMNHVALSAAS